MYAFRDVAKLKAVCGPSKLKHLSDSKAAISYTALTPQGAVIVKVGKGSLYGFERDLESWTVLSGPTADEQQEKERLDLRELAFPVGSPFLIDSAAVLAANKAELMACFLEHIASLRDHRRFQAVDELCHELWTGSGWMCVRTLPLSTSRPLIYFLSCSFFFSDRHFLWYNRSDRISDSEASATPHTLKLSKLERMDLLHQVIQVLGQPYIFPFLFLLFLVHFQPRDVMLMMRPPLRHVFIFFIVVVMIYRSAPRLRRDVSGIRRAAQARSQLASLGLGSRDHDGYLGGVAKRSRWIQSVGLQNVRGVFGSGRFLVPLDLKVLHIIL
jgi:hypothetical protein